MPTLPDSRIIKVKICTSFPCRQQYVSLLGQCSSSHFCGDRLHDRISCKFLKCNFSLAFLSFFVFSNIGLCLQLKVCRKMAYPKKQMPSEYLFLNHMWPLHSDFPICMSYCQIFMNQSAFKHRNSWFWKTKFGCRLPHTSKLILQL